MIVKLYYNSFVSFFIILCAIVISCFSCVQSSTEVTTNLQFGKIVKRATQQNNVVRNSSHCTNKNDQWRCKTSKECILKSAKCNGRKDCQDGSDEDVQDYTDKHATATTIKPKPTPVERPSNDTCNIPYHPDTTAVVLTDREDKWLNISLVDLRAPKLSKIEIFCNLNYALANGEKMQKSVCQQKGQWHPALRSCQKSCPTLRKDNTDITCYRNGSRVDCNSEMVSGTGVRPVCKPLYHSEAKIHGELTCLESGEWDRDMPKCVPGDR